MRRYSRVLAIAGLSIAFVAPLVAGELGQSSNARSSRLIYRDACGWQGAGRVAYVENSSRRNASVTIRESYSAGAERRTRTTQYSLFPGAQERVGCTRGDTSVEFRSFSIVADRTR